MPIAEQADKGAHASLVSQARACWPLFSLWTMHVWIYWYNTTPLNSSLAQVPAWASIYGVMTVALLAAAALAARKPGDSAVGRLDIPCTCAMCACTASILLAGTMAPTSTAWRLTNMVLGGVCMGWGYLRWSALFASMGIREAVACLFGSYLIGSSIKVAFDLAPSVVAAMLAFACPLVSLYSLRKAAGALGQLRGEHAAAEGPRGETIYHGRAAVESMWRVAVCVLVFCLVRQVISSATAGSGADMAGRLLSHGVEVAFAAVALAWVLRLGRPLDFPQLWRFVFLFLATSVAAECLTGTTLMARLCDGVSTSLIVMLLWLLLADVAHHSDHHPYLVFGVGWSLYVGANYAGGVLMRVGGFASLTPELGVGLLWVTGVTMAFCLETRDPDVQRIFADLRTKVDPEEFASIDERCEELARQYGLTGREVDVLKLLAKGRSKNYIAETLYISENTVRGHSRRLYAKLGVHTRDELQALLGCD